MFSLSASKLLYKYVTLGSARSISYEDKLDTSNLFAKARSLKRRVQSLPLPLAQPTFILAVLMPTFTADSRDVDVANALNECSQQ